MRAVALTQYLPINHPEALFDIELPKPAAPQGRDLLVRIGAIAVNPVDYKVRAPKDKVESSPRILGWDAVGIVEAVGSDCRLFQPGDRVYYAGDITRPGCNAEYQLVDERIVGRAPASLDDAQAAALPLTAITAWEALFDRLAIRRDGSAAGQTLLVIGGAGGVGSMAIQLAKLAGLRVVATASRPESADWCRALGADAVIEHGAALLAAAKAHGPYPYIFCTSDTDGYFAAMSELVAPQGKIVTIVESSQPHPIDLLKAKSASLHWEMMFTRSMFQTEDMQAQHALLDEVATLIDAGQLRTTLGEVLGTINAANLRRAHAQLEAGRTIGKLVLAGF